MVSLIDHAGTWALAAFTRPGQQSAVPGLVRRDHVLDLSSCAEVGRPVSTQELLERWDTAEPALAALASDTSRASWTPLADVALTSPVSPRQVFQCGANYRTHVIDLAVKHHDGSDGRTAEQVRADAAATMDSRLEHPPYVFTGLPSAICGPYDDVILPRHGEKPDWELELAAVIGRPARDLEVSEAMDAVAGWTIVNDLTLRELVLRRDMPDSARTGWPARTPPPSCRPDR